MSQIHSFTTIFCLAFTFITVSSTALDLTSLTLDQGFYILGTSTTDNFGGSVTGTGDINADGVDDFMIAAYTGITTGTTNAGVVYVIFGNKNGFSNIDLTNGLSPTQGFKINGIASGSRFGWSIGKAGDFNNDGIADLAVGSVFANYNLLWSRAGAAFILFGKSNWTPGTINMAVLSTPSDGFKIEGSMTNAYLGHSVMLAGDVNGDGIDDFITGSPNENGGAGCVYVIYGRTNAQVTNLKLLPPSDLTPSQGFKIQALTGTYLGEKVSAAGDFNGDGVDDVLLGGPIGDRSQPGLVYIIFGRKGGVPDVDISSGLSASQGIQIKGVSVGDALGATVSAAGDFNGDGISDVIIGAKTASPQGRNQAGMVFVLFGQRSGLTNIDLANGLSRNQGFKIEGSVSYPSLGATISNAGDLNGDEIDDVAIGANSNEGAVYIIYGRRTGIVDIDLENGLQDTQGFTIKYPGNKIGYSLGFAGDINGDGRPDLIMGATMPTGRATYVIYGVGFPGIEMLQQISSAQGQATQIARAFAMVLTLVNFSNAGALLFTVLADLLHYMKYMSISYPARLQYILDQPDPDFISIPYISSVPDQVQNAAFNGVIPENFAKYGIESNFLVNAWSSVITLGIIIFCIIILCLSVCASSRCKFINSKLRKLKEVLKWNYLLGIFTGYFGSIAFYTAFQIQVNTYDSDVDRLSLFICVFFNIALGFGTAWLIFIVYRFVNQSKQVAQDDYSRELEKVKEEYKGYQVVLEGFKSNSFFKQSYLLIFNLRLYFFNSVLAYLFEYPLMQAIIINVQGMLFLFYLLIMRPIKDKTELIGAISQEVILQIVHICVLCLAVVDQMELVDSNYKIIFGDIIIGCNVFFVLVGLIYLLVSFISLIRDIIKALRKKLNKNNKLQQHNITILTRKNATGPSLPIDQSIDVNDYISQGISITVGRQVSDDTLHSIQPTETPSILLSQSDMTDSSMIKEIMRNKIRRDYPRHQALRVPEHKKKRSGSKASKKLRNEFIRPNYKC